MHLNLVQHKKCTGTLTCTLCLHFAARASCFEILRLPLTLIRLQVLEHSLLQKRGMNADGDHQQYRLRAELRGHEEDVRFSDHKEDMYIRTCALLFINR